MRNMNAIICISANRSVRIMENRSSYLVGAQF
jgi:hypothetical protein